MEITDKLARYVAGLSYEQIPEEVRRIARRGLIDTLGCAIAGSVEPAGRIARELWCADGGSPRATVIGSGAESPVRLPAASAAMVNAIAGHALDYDDVNAMGHPSVPVVPAALAAAEDTNSGGRDLLTAYVCGVELETRLARAFGESHYLLGWHSTSTLGVMGAAAAAARIYRLSAEQVAIAFGIAASQACGLRQNFGTATKPFHPGHAAWAGLNAARLARAGFTADTSILEAPQGYFHVFSAGPYDLSRPMAEPDRWEMVAPGLSVKKYPCCYCTHASIDAVLALKARLKFAPVDVVAVRAALTPFFLSPLIHHRPRTGLEGKFSLEYTIAAAILDSKVVLATFTEEMVRREEARRLIEKVIPGTHTEGGEGLRGTLARVTVELGDGRRMLEEIAEPRGTAKNPLSDDELAEKFRDCCRFGWKRSDGRAEQRVARILDLLWGIERLDSLAPLTAMLG